MHLVNITLNEVLNNPIDYLIVACGYEKRSSSVAALFDGVNIENKIACLFETRRVLNWSRNYNWFLSHGFEFVKVTDGVSGEFLDLIQKIKKFSPPGRKARIIVDYSSITRSLLGVIVRAIADFNDAVEVIFIYAEANFVDPPEGNFFNETVEPVNGFWSLSEPDSPVTLIIGLGYERIRALGAREMLDPAKTLLFYTDPVTDERFLECLKKSNEILLSQTPLEDQFAYDVKDPSYLDRLLGDVCEGYADSSSVVIVPLGPKPFSLASLILAKRIRGVEVWRVSGGDLEEALDRSASGEYVISKIIYI